MGLGKTIQVLALLLVLKRERASARGARACWWRRPRCSPTGRRRSSASRPSLRAARRPPLGHAGRRAEGARRPSGSADVDLVITSYGSLLRLPWLATTRRGDLVVLDEAQAIKNPGAKQTRAAKALDGAGADRADRHAGREPPRRSVVDLRLPQPGPARLGAGSSPRFTKRLADAAAQPLRAAARPGAALHPAPAEDRPAR